MDERLKALKDKESAIQDEMEKAFQAKADVETEMDALQKRSQEQVTNGEIYYCLLTNFFDSAAGFASNHREAQK